MQVPNTTSAGGTIREIESLGFYGDQNTGKDNINAAGATYADLRGYADNDTLAGGVGGDNLEGGQGNDSLVGRAGNDQLRGQEGNDTLDGGEGDDYFEEGPQADRIIGGLGSDRLNLSGLPTGLTVNYLDPNTNKGLANK